MSGSLWPTRQSYLSTRWTLLASCPPQFALLHKESVRLGQQVSASTSVTVAAGDARSRQRHPAQQAIADRAHQLLAGEWLLQQRRIGRRRIALASHGKLCVARHVQH